MERAFSNRAEAGRFLAEKLGNLPLALEQAAAYIEESKIGIFGYLELFERHQARLLERPTSRAPRPQRTIRTVWEISLRSIERESPEAVALLNLCAFMPPDHISKEDIELNLTILPEPLCGMASESVALHDSIAILRRYSMVDATTEFISVHRLVQLVVRERLDPLEYRRFHEAADRLQHGLSDAGFDTGVDEDNTPAVRGRAEALGWIR